MRQHIAFVVNNYPPHSGGVERHVQSLAAALVRRGHRVTVVTLSDSSGVTHEDGIDVIRLRRWLPIASVMSFPLPGTGRRLRRLIRDRSVTAVSVHTRFFPMSLVGTIAARRAGIAIIHTEHGSGFVRGVSPLIALASRAVDLTMGRIVLRRATTVLAVSDAVAAFVTRLSRRRAEVFPAAIDVQRWRGDDAASATDRDGQVLPRFVFLGRMVPGKGWDAVLRAGVMLHEQGRDFTIDFIGAGPELEKLRMAVDEADAAAFARVRGHLDGTALVAAMRGAVLVNPTTLAEGFQTSLLEALSAGGSVITFEVPGAVILRDDGAPLQIVSQHSAEQLAAAMASAIDEPAAPYPPERLEQWGWGARAADYERIIEQAVKTVSISKGTTGE